MSTPKNTGYHKREVTRYSLRQGRSSPFENENNTSAIYEKSPNLSTISNISKSTIKVILNNFSMAIYLVCL